MRSRYSAFALGNYKYIIKTTHQHNQDYTDDIKKWQDSILEFCNSCEFYSLEVIDFIDGEVESFVTFTATIFCNAEDSSFTEKSRFLKENGRWLYHSGEFI